MNEDLLSEAAFARLGGWVQQSLGIQMPPSKRIMLSGRLRRRVRAVGLDSLDAYASWVLSEAGASERRHLVDAATTNKTDFFREPRHYEVLCRRVLPELLSARPRRLRVWSAASSSGEEAYTLAMVLDKAAPALAQEFLATDICSKVLALGHAGIYPAARVEPVPPEYARRYLMQGRDGASEVRVVPELRSRIDWQQLNLMDEHYDVPVVFDLIFCRNVLIYFDRPTQEAVVSRLVGHLRPGGFLFIGHSESLTGTCLPLQALEPTVYRRIAPPTGRP